MGQRRIVTIPFPLKGLNRRWAYAQQQAETAYDLLNVRPDATTEARTRGGTRPGLLRAYPTQVGADEVRLLSQVRAVPTQAAGFWSTSFDEFSTGGLFQDPLWSLPTGGQQEPEFYYGFVFDELADTDEASHAVRVAFADIDLTKAYQIRASIVSAFGGTGPPGRVFLYVGLDNTTPDITQDVLLCDLAWNLPTALACVRNRIAGVTTSACDEVTLHPGIPHLIVFDIDPVGGTALITIDGTVIASMIGISFPLPGGGRFGFGLDSNHTDQRHVGYYSLAIAYQRLTSAEANRNYLVAGANGGLKRENDEGDDLETAAAGSAADIVVTPPAPQQTIQAVDYLGKLYIADHDEPIASGIDGSVATGTALTSATNPTMGDDVDADNEVVVITGAPTPENLGTYRVASGTGGIITLAEAVDTNEGNITFRVERAAKVYDPILDTLVNYYDPLVSEGAPADGVLANQPPTGCIVIGTYMDRVVLAGGKNNPQVWFMSARGDPLDFDYSETNEGAAVAGDNSNAGQIGAPITAMIPSVADYLIFASLGSLWILRGDPTVGGRMDNLSRRIGIVGTEAWCYGPNSSIYFLSRDGLYMIPPGVTAYPQSVSEEVLPATLKTINNLTTHVTLEYDVILRGIHIHLTKIDEGNRLHYWFDLDVPGFWPFQFGNTDHAPFTTLQYEADKATSAAMLLGGRDGYLRKYFRFSSVDDATDEEPIVSYVVLGPFPLGSTPDREGMIQRLEIALGRLSNVITWKIYVANTAELAIRKMDAGLHLKQGTTRLSSGPVLSSLFSVHHPRTRGYHAVIRLENANNERWWFEQMIAIIKDVGKHRSKTV